MHALTSFQRQLWFGIALIVIVGGSAAYHLMPAADPLEELRADVIACIETREKMWRGGCFKELADRISAEYELEEILRMFAILDDAPPVKETCHALMHYVGQNAYAQTQDLPGTFGRCSTQVACGEGCFHGAVEGYISETGDTEVASIPQLCDISFAGSQINLDACNHGIGHAQMLIRDGDIMPSLDICKSLPNERAREYCYTGVFMENVFAYGNPFHATRYLDPADPEYPCTVVADEYKSACYESQSSFVFNSRGGPPASAEFCATVPEEHQAVCYGNIGGDIVVVTQHPYEVRRACDLAPEGQARDICYQQALIFRLHMTSGDVKALRAICDVAHEGNQQACDATAGEVMGDWYLNGRAAKCAEAYADDESRRTSCAAS